MFAEKNLLIFRESHPDAARLLEHTAPAIDLVFEKSVTGTITARRGELYVHSRHNPVREAETLIESGVKSTAGVCVFYGFGLGYAVEAFSRKYPDTPCAVIEPDTSFFRKALESRDMSFIFQNPLISFFLATGAEKILPFIESFPPGNVQVIKLRSVWAKDMAYYEHTDSILQTFLKRRDINRNTLARFGKLWVKNLVYNLPLLSKSEGLMHLENIFEGKLPGLVVAGGPSLEEILPLLPALSKRMVIIAVDTSLSAVCATGVTPDFTIVCDPQYWNTRHLDRANTADTILISEPSTHPRVFRMVGKTILFSGSLFPFGRFIEPATGHHHRLGAGGSVATTAWDLARFLGVKPIYMAGLDLGFPMKRTHFRGSYFENAFHFSDFRKTPVEYFSFKYLHDGGAFPVPSNNGGMVLSDQRMVVYKFWFETQMKLHQDTTTFNLGARGTRIDGMPLVQPSELASLPVCREEIDRLRTRVHSAGPRDPEIGKKLLTILESLAKDLSALKNLALDGDRLTRDLQKRMRDIKPTHTVIGKLEAIDQAIQRFPAKEIMSFIIQPIIDEISSGTQNTNPIDSSKRLYKEIRQSADFHIDLITKAFPRLS
ncbi:MAG: DUF115 domain-containing protein [Spirochaetaceae bacterium]|nr:MAG: DUF115 domain-containing protein [Spirochaetaceae bacterium]